MASSCRSTLRSHTSVSSSRKTDTFVDTTMPPRAPTMSAYSAVSRLGRASEQSWCRSEIVKTVRSRSEP